MSDDIISYSSEQKGILTSETLPIDQEPEIISLRPERLHEYIGQSEVLETLEIAIEATKQRGGGAEACFVSWAAGTWKNNPCSHHC